LLSALVLYRNSKKNRRGNLVTNDFNIIQKTPKEDCNIYLCGRSGKTVPSFGTAVLFYNQEKRE